MRRDGHEHFFLKNLEIERNQNADFDPADPDLGFLAELRRKEE
jgi:hypothetical protein